MERLSKTGLRVPDRVSWGTHICQFYETRDDLLEVLVPFLKEGLTANESCVWITSGPLTPGEAKDALRAAIPELEHYLTTGQMEIIPHEEWECVESRGRKELLDHLLVQKQAITSCLTPLVMMDFAGNMTYANPAALKAWRFDDENECLNRFAGEFWENPGVLVEYIERVLAGGSINVIEMVAKRKDGSNFDAEVLGSRVIDDRGQLIGMVASCEDITARKRAREALEKERRNLRRLLQSRDHERQLIAYEIHDGLAQQLAGALMQFQTFAHLKDKNPKEAAKAYDAGTTMLQQAYFEARRLIAGVRPPILDESGVVEAISHLVHEKSRDSGTEIEYRSKVAFDRLDPTLENAVYRIAQEALTNACRYSASENVRVTLFQRGDEIRIEIQDWGTGFDPKAVPKNRFGLEGIRQRARLLGGKCSIRSTAGKGTRIAVSLPVVLRD